MQPTAESLFRKVCIKRPVRALATAIDETQPVNSLLISFTHPLSALRFFGAPSANEARGVTGVKSEPANYRDFSARPIKFQAKARALARANFTLLHVNSGRTILRNTHVNQVSRFSDHTESENSSVDSFPVQRARKLHLLFCTI